MACYISHSVAEKILEELKNKIEPEDKRTIHTNDLSSIYRRLNLALDNVKDFSIVEKIRNTDKGNKFINIAEPAVCVVLFVLITAYLVDGSFNPFLYFRF